MPLPISHSLVGAGLAALSRPQSSLKRDWPVLLLAAFLATTPDFDFFLIWGLHLSRSFHRGPTHSIFLAAIVTGLMLLGSGFSNVRTVLACGAAFLSHGILDFLTTKLGGGVELLWPFSDVRLKLGVVGFSEFPNGFHLAEVVRSSLIEVAVFTPVLLAVLLIREYRSQASAPQGAQPDDSSNTPSR